MNKFYSGKRFILGDRVVCYHSCPKNGCTSVKTMIMRIFGDKRTNKEHRPWPHTVIGCSNFVPYQADFKFCVIRDPVERFVSGFSNRVLHYREIPETDFSEFVDNFDFYYKKYPAINWHFSPQIRFLGNDPSYYTNIFWTNEMPLVKDFLENLSQTKIGSVAHEQTGGSKRKPFPTTEQVEFIKKFYAKDYSFLMNIAKEFK